MVQFGHTGVYVGRGWGVGVGCMWKEGGCGWVDGGGRNTHVHESCAHTDCGLHNPLYLPSLSPRSPLALPLLSPHSPLALPRVMVRWTREKVLATRCSLIGEPTRTCIVGHSPSSPRW